MRCYINLYIDIGIEVKVVLGDLKELSLSEVVALLILEEISVCSV